MLTRYKRVITHPSSSTPLITFLVVLSVLLSLTGISISLSLFTLDELYTTPLFFTSTCFCISYSMFCILVDGMCTLLLVKKTLSKQTLANLRKRLIMLFSALIVADIACAAFFILAYILGGSLQERDKWCLNDIIFPIILIHFYGCIKVLQSVQSGLEKH